MYVFERQHDRLTPRASHYPIGHRGQLPAPQFLWRQSRRAFLRQWNIEQRSEQRGIFRRVELDLRQRIFQLVSTAGSLSCMNAEIHSRRVLRTVSKITLSSYTSAHAFATLMVSMLAYVWPLYAAPHQEANLAAAQEVAKVIQRPSPRLASGSMSEFRGIVLQKSKVAEPRIFRENTKQERVADSYTLNRLIEVACEFNAI